MHFLTAQAGASRTGVVQQEHFVSHRSLPRKNRRSQSGAYDPGVVGWYQQALQGSFSAVSKPNFARKYAFESSRRDLHNALLCTALKSHVLIVFFKKC